MHLSLNKPVHKKVQIPEFVGLLVVEYQAVAYKMGLKHDGQYRMIEINRFRFTRDLSDDILLIPAIIEKLNHARKVVKRTADKIYRHNNEEDGSLVDRTAYMREACKCRVLINQ